MQPPVEANVSDLSHGFSINYVIVNVDRIFVRESAMHLNDPPRLVKEYGSLDMLCWDRQVYTLHIVNRTSRSVLNLSLHSMHVV